MQADAKTDAGRGGGGEGVLCAKCHHLNPAEQTTCESCGSRLYITCGHCGRRNKRVASHCAECGARLHRSAWRRWRHRLAAPRGRVNLLQIVAAILAAFIVYKIIVMLAEYSPPPPE